MIEKPRPDILTLSTTFYDLSVTRNLFSKCEMRQFGASGTEELRYGWALTVGTRGAETTLSRAQRDWVNFANRHIPDSSSDLNFCPADFSACSPFQWFIGKTILLFLFVDKIWLILFLCMTSVRCSCFRVSVNRLGSENLEKWSKSSRWKFDM